MNKDAIVFSGRQDTFHSSNVSVVKHYDREGVLWGIALTLMGEATFRVFIPKGEDEGMNARLHRSLDRMEQAIEEARAWLAQNS